MALIRLFCENLNLNGIGLIKNFVSIICPEDAGASEKRGSVCRS